MKWKIEISFFQLVSAAGEGKDSGLRRKRSPDFSWTTAVSEFPLLCPGRLLAPFRRLRRGFDVVG